MALLTARVTTANFRVQGITASLEIDRRIRASLVLDRPIDAVGTGRLNFVYHAAAARRAASSANTGAHLVGEGSRARESRWRGARVDAVSQAIARGCRGPLGAAGPDLARLEHFSAGHAASARNVEGDFGVVGTPGAVEIFELEELRLQFSGGIAAVAALQKRSGAERCWDSCCVRKSGAEHEGVEGGDEVHGGRRDAFRSRFSEWKGSSCKRCVVRCELR